MDAKKFEGLFGIFYYLTLKEQKGVKLASYLKWKCKDHEHFKLFYKCLHTFKDYFPKHQFSVPNDKQKKRFYALFRKTDFQGLKLKTAEDKFKKFCSKTGKKALYYNVIQLFQKEFNYSTVEGNTDNFAETITDVEVRMPFDESDEPNSLNIKESERMEIYHANNSIIENNISYSSNVSNPIIDVTNTSSEEIEEYIIIKNKVNSIETAETQKNNDSVIHTFLLDGNESSYIYVHRNNPSIIKFIYCVLRKKIEIIIKCYICFTSHAWNQDKKKLRIYAQCTYFKEGCKKYNFYLYFIEGKVKVEIVMSNKPQKHPEEHFKIPQVRGVERGIVKLETRSQYPSVWRDSRLYKMKDDSRAVITIPTKDVTRKIKSEHKRSLDRSSDPVTDISLMWCDKGWKQFIQRFSRPQTIYLFSSSQLRLGKQITQYSRNTLFFDATGSVMQKWDSDSKRVFLYSLIAHVKLNVNEPGILLPIAESFQCSHYAESIEEFLNAIRLHCVLNKIKWPIAKRVCVDFSWASINAVIVSFNKDAQIYSVENYLDRTFDLSHDNNVKFKFTSVQICSSHMCRIIIKDIKMCTKLCNVEYFLIKQIFFALNICDVSIYWDWLESLFSILLSKYMTNCVQLAERKLKNFVYETFDSNMESSEEVEYTSGSTQYESSPFYLRGLEIYNRVLENINKNEINKNTVNEYYNEAFASILLKKYTAYCPLWTNIIGKFADSNHTRVSNGPVESYFDKVKNKLGLINVRCTDYIRKSYKYITARRNEIRLQLQYGRPRRQKKSYQEKKTLPKLLVEKWKRTPKKLKQKINSKTIYIDKLFRTIPEALNNKNYHFLRFKQIFLKNYNNRWRNILVYDILLHEYLDLNPPKFIYNNVIDIYINILIYENNMSVYSLVSQEGNQIFYNRKNIYIPIPINCFDYIIIPIIYGQHFTIVFLNTKSKEFSYLDPLNQNTGEMADTNMLFRTFQSKYDAKDWTINTFIHDKQTDFYNCGVLISQYVECFLKKEQMEGVLCPNEYRKIMKNKLLQYSQDMTNICLHCGDEIDTFDDRCAKCCRYVCSACFSHHYKQIKTESCIFCSSQVP